MKLNGPIITLAVGGAAAAVLLIVNSLSTSGGSSPTAASSSASSTTSASAAGTTSVSDGATSAPATSPPTSAATTATQPPAVRTGTYAGDVNGGPLLALVIKNGHALAYLCDGHAVESWVWGATDGRGLVLRGTASAHLAGTVTASSVTGTLWAHGHSWTFTLRAVKPPSGLYRATGRVRGAQVVAGWIVLANGRQVGLTDINGVAVKANPLNPTTGQVLVNGATVIVSAADPSTPPGA